METNNRLSIIFSTVIKFAAFGVVIGAIKSGIVAAKTDIGPVAFLMAPAIGATLFGFVGLVAGLVKAGIHKTKFEGVANKEMGYLGQIIAAIVLFGVIVLISYLA